MSSELVDGLITPTALLYWSPVRALSIDEAVYGPEHPTVVTLRNNLTRL